MFLEHKSSNMREDGWLSINRHLGSFISIKGLVETKKIALRNGLWYRTLNRVERGIIDLTVRYVDNVKSEKLVKVLATIIKKLQFASESALDKLVRNIGLPLAQKISDIAVSWGNCLASKWADDLVFARFLVLNSARKGLER
jgi:hypothetical protein